MNFFSFDFGNVEPIIIRDYDIYRVSKKHTNNIIHMPDFNIFLAKAGNIIEKERPNLRNRKKVASSVNGQITKLKDFVLNEVIPSKEKIISKSEYQGPSILGHLLPKDAFYYKGEFIRIVPQANEDPVAIYFNNKKYNLCSKEKLALTEIVKQHKLRQEFLVNPNISEAEGYNNYTRLGFKSIGDEFFLTYKTEKFSLFEHQNSSFYDFPSAELGIILNIDRDSNIVPSDDIYLLSEGYLHPSVIGKTGVRSCCTGSCRFSEIKKEYSRETLGMQVARFVDIASYIFTNGYNPEKRVPHHRLCASQFNYLRRSKK